MLGMAAMARLMPDSVPLIGIAIALPRETAPWR